MTVSYQYDVASSASGGFIRLLFRWRGSVWKVVYREMALFSVCYVLLTVLYQFALTEGQQRIFEKVVYFCSTFMDLIPLSFMLGFYVSFIAARWWSQFIAIPWPDKLMNIVAMYIPGLDESSRVVRRTLMRYLNLSLVLVLRSISMAVKRRFPTKEHLIEAGFMTKTELEMFQSVPSTEFNTFWIPCTWFINVLREARQECRITDSNGLKLIMEELNEFRSKCGLLWGYDWISIPLVYTQVVTMATYAFFVACMFGRQNVNTQVTSTHRYDFYIPIFTILQLMFYMGLLKVAEQLINPFGDDDEDFELNWIIDRHMKVSYLGVDTLNGTPPPLVKDTYYDELDVKIPYTEASKSYKKKTYRGSVAYMQVPMEQQGMVQPDMSEEEDDGETVSESMGPRRPSVYTLFQSRMSNFRGVSPASSYTNLDNRSIASLDSEWKCSLTNVSSATKNASGTLGPSETPNPNVDMAMAEDDEMVLQEVIIDPDMMPRPSICSRSGSLQIPGKPPVGAKEKKSSTMLGMLRELSPKIAPKFPREKLKSMFRKSKKISAAFPFYKLKGVHFSREKKEEGSLNESLLDVSYQDPADLEITLSTPELTEIEKETGVHPYYFTQQKIASAKELVTRGSFLVRQPHPPQYGSQEGKKFGVRDPNSRFPTRSSSLPNIRQRQEMAVYLQDPIVAASLKKITTAKEAESQVKKKKKIKPTQSESAEEKPKDDEKKIEPSQPSSEEQQSKDASVLSETKKKDSTGKRESGDSRRNTLPQITLTRCGQRAPISLELSPTVSPGHSTSPSIESISSLKQLPKDKGESRRSSVQRRTSEPMKSYTVPSKSGGSRRDSKSHSTKPTAPAKPSPIVKINVEGDDSPKTTSKFKKRSPPPKRQDSLSFEDRTPMKPSLVHKSSSEMSSDDFDVSPPSPTKPKITRTPSIPSKPSESVDPSQQVKRPPTTSHDPAPKPFILPEVVSRQTRKPVLSGPSAPRVRLGSIAAVAPSHGPSLRRATPRTDSTIAASASQTVKRPSVAESTMPQLPETPTDSVTEAPSIQSPSIAPIPSRDTDIASPDQKELRPRTDSVDLPKTTDQSLSESRQEIKPEKQASTGSTVTPLDTTVLQSPSVQRDSVIVNIPECDVPTQDPVVPKSPSDSAIITISDSQEDIRGQQGHSGRPPEPPQRHVPRSSSRGKK